MALFAPSKRSQRKLAEGVARILGPGPMVRGIFTGRAHARATTFALVYAGVFCAVFVVALAFGQIIFPGGVLLFVVFNSVRPPRVVVVADTGVAVLARSPWTGRPNSVVVLLAPAALGAVATLRQAKPGTVNLGAERITFPKREHDGLLRAAGF